MPSSQNQRYHQVGIDRLVRLKWLEQTALLAMAGNIPSTIKAVLQKELLNSFRSSNTQARGSIDKTITILMKIWVNAPRELRSLQGDGLKLMSTMPDKERLLIHWGMTMAVYPFWGSVAAHLGRLLRLQGTASVGQVQRRAREQYGERETVSRRVRYVLRSFVDWKVLEEASDKGVYQKVVPYAVDDPELIAWLTEASLFANINGSAGFKDLLDNPNLFPFRLARISGEQLLSMSPRLDILRHGLDEDLVMLKMGDFNTNLKN